MLWVFYVGCRIVLIWRWMIYDHSDEKREAADYHLAKLKRQYPEIATEKQPQQ